MADNDLSPRQRSAIAALMGCPTVVEAAAAAGVSEASVRRWLTDETFQSELRAAQRRLWTSVGRALSSKAIAAVDTLARIMADDSTPPGARVTAARTILDAVFKLADDDLTARVEAIEARLEGSRP